NATLTSKTIGQKITPNSELTRTERGKFRFQKSPSVSVRFINKETYKRTFAFSNCLTSISEIVKNKRTRDREGNWRGREKKLKPIRLKSN
ncbi:hypothetical protein, partial [Vibrio alginolyticus]|uniref:hypothetical protein n=1 Tax=Vibrio alginolyticus TaxID=663 RepID=UPI00301DF286